MNDGMRQWLKHRANKVLKQAEANPLVAEAATKYAQLTIRYLKKSVDNNRK